MNNQPIANPEEKTLVETSQPEVRFPRNRSERAKPEVSDHELLRPIGSGSYGEVWLARNIMGVYRAVKVVYRDTFESDKPFEREFEGIKRFEPISRVHESQIDILHIGRNDQAGYFYYVMELADDAGSTGLRPAPNENRTFDPGRYEPRTLRSELRARGRLPVEECSELALALTTALEHLHSHDLVHRDVKPANVIFVHGRAKLADIGLVARSDATLSFVGTEGYLPPEGPGKPSADVYSLGKVLYEAATGKDRMHFPEAPTLLGEQTDRQAFLEFNEVLIRACENSAAARYQSAREMHEDLLLLRAGGSLKRSRLIERRLAFLKRAGAAVTAVAAVAIAAFFYRDYQTREARRLATENRELAANNLQLAKTEAAQKEVAEQSLRQIELQRIERKFETEESGQALIQLAEQIRRDPEDSVVGHRLFSALTYRNFALPIAELPLTDEITSIDVSPEGRWFATATADGIVNVWSLDDGRRLLAKEVGRVHSLEISPTGGSLLIAGAGSVQALDPKRELAVLLTLPHDLSVNDATYSSDGARIATASGDHLATIWNAQTGEKVLSVRHKERNVSEVHFTPDGAWLVTKTGADEVTVWNASSGELLRARGGAGSSGLELSDRIVVHPDSKRLSFTSGLEYSHLRVWNFATDETAVSRQTHRYPILSVDYSPDGRRVVTGSSDQTIRVWRAADASAILSPIRQPGGVTFVKFSPNGTTMASGSRRGVVRLWDADTGRPIGEPLRHPGIVRFLAFSPDGRTLVSACDHTVWLWDIRPGQARPLTLHHASNEAEKWFVRAWFLDDGKRVVTKPALSIQGGIWTPWSLVGGLSPGFFRLWDAVSGEALTPPMPHSRCVDQVAHDPISDSILSIGFDGGVRIWRAADGELLHEHRPHSDRFGYGAHLFRGGQRALTTAGAGPPTLWQTKTGEILRRFDPGAATWGFDLSADERLVAVEAQDGRAVVFEVATGEVVFEMPGGPARFSPDGRLLAVRLGAMAQLVDTETWVPVHDPLRHDDKIEGMKFSGDSRYLVTCSLDQSARIWNVKTGRQTSPQLDHDWMVVDADFSPDNNRVATASWDATARIWDISSGLAMSEPLAHHDSVIEVDYGPRGNWLITGTKEAHARVWEIVHFTEPVPGWVADLSEILGGRLAPSSHSVYQRLFEIKRQIQSRTDNDYFTRWGRWFFDDRERRTISPASHVGTQRYLARRLEEDTLRQGSALTEALSYSPMEPYLLARLGRKFTVRKFWHDFQIDFDQAHWFTRLASRLDPDLATARWASAEVFLAEQKLDAARAAVEQALELDPNDPNAWYLRSRIQDGLGEHRGGFDSFRKAVQRTIATANHSEADWEWDGYLHEVLLPFRSELLGSNSFSRILRVAKWRVPHAQSKLDVTEADWLSALVVEMADESRKVECWKLRADALEKLDALESGTANAPQLQTAAPGDNVTLSVRDESNPELAGYWFHKDRLLPRETGATLILSSVTVAAAGEYSVLIHDSDPLSRRIGWRHFQLLVGSGAYFRGGLLREQYSNQGSAGLEQTSPVVPMASQTADAKVVGAFELTNIPENTTARLRGYLVPPETGEYVFFLASDDASELFLSADASPANARRIASEPFYQSRRNWTGKDRRPHGENISASITLQAGSPYFMEAAVRNGVGDGHVAVAWRRPSDEAPPEYGSPPIPGQYLAIRAEDVD